MEKLRALRKESVLSIGELAARAKVHRNTIMRLERGEPARPATIRRVAEVLGIEPRELIKS